MNLLKYKGAGFNCTFYLFYRNPGTDMDYYVENFTDMWEYVFLESGRDMWVVLKLSMEVNKKAQSKMRALIQEFEHLDEIISYEIKNPCCFTALKEIFQYAVEMAP